MKLPRLILDLKLELLLALDLQGKPMDVHVGAFQSRASYTVAQTLSARDASSQLDHSKTNVLATTRGKA